MAAHLTNYGADALLDGTAMPTTLWVKHHISDPGADATNGAAAETTRQSFVRDTAVDGVTANTGVIQWLNAAANETLTHISLWDASTAGNPWWVVARTGGGLVVEATDTISIDAGDLDMIFSVWAG